MKHLPIGISTLKTIINENFVYIDKTEYAHRLTEIPGRYFLSRPRRFGKSLFVDTLKEIFEGNKELFKGLYIYDKRNWDKKYPVIKLDFTGGVKSAHLLELYIRDMLETNAKRLDINLNEERMPIEVLFKHLIRLSVEKYSCPAVVLIDEYDKPLLDNIDNNDVSKEIREGLKNFYSVIKEQDANLQFVFLTGVTKFSKENIFSGINNLKDLSLDSNYAAICGYTQHDLETSFREHLDGVNWAKLRKWYNGYNFLGEPVYNPFDILLFISENKVYRNYWFETGTPSFLIKLMQKNRYFLPELDNLLVGEELLSSFEIDTMEPTTLLFQSGYLTIDEMITKREQIRFRLRYPNREVKISFNEYLITGFTGLTIEKHSMRTAPMML